MREILTVLLVALVGGMAGGAAIQATASWARRMDRRRGYRRSESAGAYGAQHGPGMERRELDLLRNDLWKISEAVGRVLQEVSDLSRRVGDGGRPAVTSAPTAGGAFGPSAWERSPVPLHDRPPREDGWQRGPDASDPGARGRSYEPAPLRQSPYDAPPGPYDAPLAQEVAATTPRPAAGPPANAVNVEARDDRIVASSSYPPEAWLEPRGPAVAHLWLNPNVALNENALRRLSTFFEWRPERAGASYDTEQPAVLRWDEGQRVGTVTTRGTARPR